MAQEYWKRIAQNWQSGLTVALVSIPLSLSLAIASGATPIMGIITAVWAGGIAGIFGGSHYNIIGPAGALSGILLAYTLKFGAATLPLLAIIAGICILIACAFRLERFLVFIPGSTIHGFTLGVGIIIALSQLNTALGLHGLPAHDTVIENLGETLRYIANVSPASISIAVLFLIILFLLAKKLPKIPGAILIAPVAILLGMGTKSGLIPLPLETLGDRFGTITPQLFRLPQFTSITSSLVITAVTVAVVAILETMISARIADGMVKKNPHNERKEMFGLGLANIVTGIAGGLPATGVLVRTALNVKSHATHKISQLLNGIFVALIALLLLQYFRYIPMAAIAAILIFISIRMVEQEHFARLWRHDKQSFFLAITVAGITVFDDPVVGILFGTALALLFFVQKISLGHFEATVASKHAKSLTTTMNEETLRTLGEQHDLLVYSIKGTLAYVNGQAHLQRFNNNGFIDPYRVVILRLRELSFIDIDGVDVLDEIIDRIREQGKDVYISGANPQVAEALQESSENYPVLLAQKHIGETSREIIDALI